MNLLQKALLTGLFGLGMYWPWEQTAAAPTAPAKVKVSREPISSELDLVRRSDLVVYGRISDHTTSHPTGGREGTYRVVNYIQKISVKGVWKGQVSGQIQLLTSGVEPLPDADNPLNRVYTGPLAANEYVCFLHRVPGTDYYTLTGLWKGLHPVFEGKSVSLLANGGFSSFHGLSLRQFQSKVKAMAGS